MWLMGGLFLLLFFRYREHVHQGSRIWNSLCQRFLRPPSCVAMCSVWSRVQRHPLHSQLPGFHKQRRRHLWPHSGLHCGLSLLCVFWHIQLLRSCQWDGWRNCQRKENAGFEIFWSVFTSLFLTNKIYLKLREVLTIWFLKEGAVYTHDLHQLIFQQIFHQRENVRCASWKSDGFPGSCVCLPLRISL